MKSLRHALLVVCALSTAACGVDSASAPDGADAPDTQVQAAASTQPPLPNSCLSSIPALPTGLPTAPTPMSQLPQGRALYLPGTHLLSAYTVVVTDPNDSNAFYAFGFDVRAQRGVFWLSGYKSRGDLRRLNAQLANDIEVIEQSSVVDLGFTWGSSGQVGGPLIPRPGIAEGAWKVAFNNHYQLDSTLVAPQRAPKESQVLEQGAGSGTGSVSGSSSQVGGPILPQPGV